MNKLHVPNKATSHLHESYNPELTRSLVDPVYAMPDYRTNYFESNIVIEPPISYVGTQESVLDVYDEKKETEDQPEAEEPEEET